MSGVRVIKKQANIGKRVNGFRHGLVKIIIV